ncbi:MAG: hypothetical protein LBM04_12895 [Opitutaceae bacterium]|jgi:hypothetical protein|nr:hypothetical protein [Opitutaceae bacterium]
MPDFLQDFLHQEIGSLRRDAPPRLHLAAFGKHPAWNDHMEDIGLDTLTLIEAKRYLYLEGISGQIDTGAWDRLPPVSPAETYNHWLLWHRTGECLLGRLVSSSDGKGRTRYPFVVMAHIIGVPVAVVLRDCFSALETITRAGRAAATVADTRHIIAQGRVTLAAALAASADAIPPLPPGLRPEIDHTGWTRILHVVESQLHGFAPSAPPHTGPGCALRLPAASPLPAPDLLWWTAFWLTQLDARFPVLHLAREGADWLDTIVGEPDSPHFLCLRADRTALPAVTDIPYALAPHSDRLATEIANGADASGIPVRGIFHLTPTRDHALALLSRAAPLREAARPAGLLAGLRRLLGG